MARINYRFDPNRTDRPETEVKKELVTVFKGSDQTWINYKGYFSLEHVYKRLYEYLSGEIGYTGPFGDDMFESYFFENRGADGTIKEVWCWWRPSKVPDKNKMFKYIINIDMQLLGVKSETIVVDGQKVKQNYGEISFYVKPFIYLDLKAKTSALDGKSSWSEDWVTKNFLKWFEKRVYVKQIDQRKNEVYGHANGVIGCIKNHLKIAGFQKFRSQDFHPQRGYPQTGL